MRHTHKPRRPACPGYGRGEWAHDTRQGRIRTDTQTMAWDTEGTKRRILEAAVDEFARLGPDGATIDRIARTAGVNKERVYNYFGDKRGLFAAVLRSELDTAWGKSLRRRPRASMKKATVEPLPTPTTLPGVSQSSAFSAAACLSSS